MIKYDHNDLHILPPGPVRRLIVNRYAIQNNAANQQTDPPVAVVEPSGQTHTAHTVFIDGPSHLLYDPTDPCQGAVVYVETDARLVLMTYVGVEVNEELKAAFAKSVPVKTELQTR